MITLEPSARLTIPQILGHNWLKETNEMQQSDSDEEEEEEENTNNDISGKTNNNEQNNDKQVVSGSNGGEGGVTGNKDNVDLQAIQGNVNYVNVDNLFYHENYKNKLSYIDYCCITEDFTS